MRIGLVAAAVAMVLLGATAHAQESIRHAIQTSSVSQDPVVKFSDLQTQSVAPKKSVFLAVAYSLILPGLGDLYADNSRAAKYFFGADLGLWVTYGGFRTYGNWIKQDARTYAVEHAGADFSSKGSQFEVDLGNFANVGDYNSAKLRNREYDLVYDPNSTFAWQWSSDADRLRYKDLRIKGDGMFRNSQFVVGALVLNRVIGAISAARSVTLFNRASGKSGAWQLQANVSGGVFAAHGISIELTKEF